MRCILAACVLALVLLTGCRSANESAVEGVALMDLSLTGAAPAVTFSWPAVEGAATYEVVVLDDAGHAAWSWSGRSMSVGPPGHAPIPDKGTATVAAYDAQGAPIGLSDPVEFE